MKQVSIRHATAAYFYFSLFGISLNLSTDTDIFTWGNKLIQIVAYLS